MANNSFINILESDPDENDEIGQPHIMKHPSYHDFETLSSTLSKSKKLFSIFSTNIQSLNAKTDEFKIFVESPRKLNYTFSAVCIQESWLSENDDTSQIELEDCKCIIQGKSCSSKVGQIIYLNKQCDYIHKLK